MSRERRAAALAAGLGALIWALSPAITGKAEPWDANSAYYSVALVVAGFASGLFLPAQRKAHYGGAVLGQALYGLVVLRAVSLVVPGVLVLMVYSLLFLAGAMMGMRLNKLPIGKGSAE